MLFAIHTSRPQSQGSETWFYDNLSNAVYAPNGQRVRYEESKEASNWVDQTRTPSEPRAGNAKPDGEGIDTLNLHIGSKCNCHCSYCLQAAYRNVQERYPTEDVIRHYLDEFQDRFGPLKRGAKINIWGGEPLVYRKALTALIPGLRDRFGWDKKIRTFSNGLLMTEEDVDFFHRYAVTLRISHDGPGHRLREYKDPFLTENPIRDAWLRLHKITTGSDHEMRFHAVLSPMNANIFAIQAFFRTHIGDDVRFDVGDILSYVGVKHSESTFGPMEKNLLADSIFQALLREPNNWPSLTTRRDAFMRAVIVGEPSSNHLTRCNPTREGMLITDLEGNKLYCPHQSAQTIEREGVVAIHRSPIKWSARKFCRFCPVVMLCRGGCPMLDDESHHLTCTNEMLFALAVFRSVWFSLTNTVVTKIQSANRNEASCCPEFPLMNF